MGGGGGTFSKDRTPEKVQQRVRTAEEKAISAEFDTEVNEALGGLLSAYNSRDVAATQSRLDELKDALKEALAGTVDTVYGGSVAKHTYVDGISDVDTLAILNDTKLNAAGPQKALRTLEQSVKAALPSGLKVSRGQIALTIEYPDGMVLQVLPAIRVGNQLRIPTWKKNSWSEIDPEKFRAALSKRNEECASKLIPTVKLVKAINAALPEDIQLSGYHIESLAISAFRGYRDPCTFTRMLQHFFERAPELVMRPLTDRTGQSINVDTYLGTANSEARARVSAVLDRISRRIRNAHAGQSKDQWLELFEF